MTKRNPVASKTDINKTSQNKEITMFANTFAFFNSKVENVEVAFPELTGDTENDIVAWTAALADVDIVRTCLRKDANFEFVKDTYDAKAVLGAITNLIRFGKYNGTIGNGTMTYRSGVGLHIFTKVREGFANDIGLIHETHPLFTEWDMPARTIAEMPWYVLRQRGTSIFPVKLQEGMIVRSRSHDWIDLLLTKDVSVWVAPIRRLLAIICMEWVMSDTDALELQSEKIAAKNAGRQMWSTHHKIVDADPATGELKTEALPIVLKIFGTNETKPVEELVGKVGQVYLRNASTSAKIGIPKEIAVNDFWKTVSSSGYYVKL